MVRYAVFVVNFPGYSIQSPPTVSHTRTVSSLYVHTLNTMHEYVTVCSTNIFLLGAKRIVFVPLCTSNGNPSVSRPNSVDRPFSRGLLFYLFLLH